MRNAKNRKHELKRVRKMMKNYLKNNSLTSRSKKNNLLRDAMGVSSIEYVLIDGIIYT